MEEEEEEEEGQLSSHPFCYWALVDLPDGFQNFRDYYFENCSGVHSRLELILCTNTSLTLTHIHTQTVLLRAWTYIPSL